MSIAGVAWVLNQPGLGRHQRLSMLHRRHPGSEFALCGRRIPRDAVPSSVGTGMCKQCERMERKTDQSKDAA